MDLDKQNAYTDVINSKWYAILTPIEGLSITANIGANVRNQRSNELSNPFYGSSVSSGGAVYVAHYREFAINQQYLATYKKTFANLHNFDVLAGYESYNLKIQELQGSNTKIYNPTIGELSVLSSRCFFPFPSGQPLGELRKCRSCMAHQPRELHV